MPRGEEAGFTEEGALEPGREIQTMGLNAGLDLEKKVLQIQKGRGMGCD